MTRKTLLAAFALAASLAAPAGAQSVLRYAPSSDLATLDAMITTATTVGQHGSMVYDTLYSLDENREPRPQMVGREEVSPDGLTYRMTLRPNLRFHDGQPVTSEDVVASLNRWMVRDTLGQLIKANLVSLTAEGGDTVVFVLSRPFPFLRLALGSIAGSQPIIYRRQDAAQDPFRPITTAVGSGPFRFIPSRYILGVGAAWERNPDYVPRDEPVSGLAGGKRALVDRVELHFIPDAATRGNALRRGEIDLIDQLPADMIPLLQRDRNVVVTRISSLASISYLRPNFLFPPFNDVRARQALALAVSQPDFMAAGYGTQEWWQPACFSFFGCDTPNGVQVGSEPYRQQNLERARTLLRESGYNGERIVLIGTSELPAQQALAEVAADALRRIGANVDLQLMDFASVQARRLSKANPNAGGWHLTPSALSGTGMWTPLLNVTINTNCEQRNYLGWPCNENIERLRAAYAAEPDAARRAAILEEMSRALWEFLPVILTGNYYSPFAWRREVSGVIRTAPLVFWNIEKR
ncbi:ABC transporter substrate-binding protein [Muricoccus radiodurans]|uniref:ABC transporter substrate-binding protein n=1 Tax=Muricoccus radiodurans TaxID=2231721 RepID=UPI003CEF0B9C